VTVERAPNVDPGAVRASVLVIAHDRRDFLREAVESVLAQDLDRSQYEIIVVKNFEESKVDAFLDGARVRRIESREPAGAPKIVEGLRASQGRVICILDYDDQFEPDRLRTVLHEFESDPTLGLYRNQLSYIGPDGQPIHGRALWPHRLQTPRPAGRVRLTDENKEREILRVAGKHPEFNTSTFAVRREILEAGLPYLSRLAITVDTFLFFAALCSRWSILLDDRRLTRYRVHGLNTSVSGTADTRASLKRLADFAQTSDRYYRVIRELAVASHREFAIRQLDARILVNRATLAMRDPDAGRRAFARELLDLLGATDTYPVRENVYSIAAAVAFTVSPEIARALYARSISAG